MAPTLRLRKHRPDGAEGDWYEPAPGDPVALQWACPICPADVGEWCGGLGDVHVERERAP